MSKIRLTGETSGYVEISAGDAATNNTLELPTSGTKVVASDDNGNITTAGIVTATGGFGVGTGASVYSPATNVLALGTNNTEKVRIDSSGNFNLVNTAGIMTAFKYETPALINNHFKSQSTTASAYVRMYAAAGSGQWDIYGNGANLRFSDNASSGNIQMDRPLSMNGQNIIMSSGNGIDFSATANSSGTMTSELLADYEEGTWTPTFYLGDVLQTYNVDIQNCTYTRIGRIVHLEFWTGWGTYGRDAFPSSSGSIFEISGIPYSASAFYGASMGQARTQAGTSANLGLSILYNDNRISFTNTTGNFGSWYGAGRLGASSISGSTVVVIAGSITYKV